MNHSHILYDSDPHFKIDAISRKIIKEPSSKTTLIQHDHNSERFTFEMPRYIEGHDMSTCNKVEIHYLNIETTAKSTAVGVYTVDDLQLKEDDDQTVVCSWLISNNATRLVGQLNFLIRFSCVNDDAEIDYAWNTGIYTGISISSGIYNSEVVMENYADVLEEWRKTLFDISESFAKAKVEGDTLVIENTVEPTNNELAEELANGTFEVRNATNARYAGVANQAEEAMTAGTATNAINDSEGRKISDTYVFPFNGYIQLSNRVTLPRGTIMVYWESSVRPVKHVGEKLEAGTVGIENYNSALYAKPYDGTNNKITNEAIVLGQTTTDTNGRHYLIQFGDPNYDI